MMIYNVYKNEFKGRVPVNDKTKIAYQLIGKIKNSPTTTNAKTVRVDG